MLKHHAHPAAKQAGIHAGIRIFVIDEHLSIDSASGNPVIHAVQAAQERRLAASRWAYQGSYLMLGNIEVDMLERMEVAIVQIEVAGAYLRVRAFSLRDRRTSDCVGFFQDRRSVKQSDGRFTTFLQRVCHARRGLTDVPMHPVHLMRARLSSCHRLKHRNSFLSVHTLRLSQALIKAAFGIHQVRAKQHASLQTAIIRNDPICNLATAYRRER